MNVTKIEWTHRPETGGTAGGRTWNPIRARLRSHNGEPLGRNGKKLTGTFCTRISPGCTHCYASTINKRFGNGLEYTVPNLEKIEFFIDEKILEAPLRDKKPRTIFVGDMFDLFHEAIPLSLIGPVLDVAQVANWHTLQFLTKRAKRMQEVFSFRYTPGPPPLHIWAGVSVEDQPRADERIPLLLETPAAVRFLSVEPMLEAIDITAIRRTHAEGFMRPLDGRFRTIDWVICGGESGPGARPMHPQWARSLRDQCQAADVPFFFKQWGEWQPHQDPPDRNGSYHGGIFLLPNGQLGNQGDWWEGRAQAMDRVGKKKAGALLDGREWREFPGQKAEVVSA